MRPNLKEMSLREKIAQTGMPAPNEVRAGVQAFGSYAAYFRKYPFSGLYAHEGMCNAKGEAFLSPEEAQKTFRDASQALPIPLLISCDCEQGANTIFPELHAVSANMSLGAARDPELAYQRSRYWTRELQTFGINWPFGPVVDLHTNFFSTSGSRRLSSDPVLTAELAPWLIRGIQDTGAAACAKHFPGASPDYRDSHFCPNSNTKSKEQWYAQDFQVWKSAVEAGVMSIMVGHSAFPAIDDSCARPGIPRPASASKKVLDILRKDLNFDGLIITDAVSMKGVASAFEHDDVYIECLNAGNDIILFCHNDYIDVIEKAVLDGRVSMSRVDEACRRVLDLKEKIGLFNDESPCAQPLTDAQNRDMEQVLYNIGRQALTLLNNRGDIIPVDPEKLKNVTIIALSPDDIFQRSMSVLTDAFAKRGIQVEVIDRIENKAQLQQIADTKDLIIYACFLAQGRPLGMSVYSRKQDMSTLFNSLSYGAEKSVVVSFGAASIYYNYFENADAYINAYSPDPGTMQAFVDGILGDFELTGSSPIPLRPEFREL